MQKISLDALAREQLALAAPATAHRAAHTVFGGHEHTLRQTLIALTAGTSLAEHNNPGEATIHVLSGRVTLVCGDDTWSGRTGDLLIVPPAPHSLQAVTDTTILLTAVSIPTHKPGPTARPEAAASHGRAGTAATPSATVSA